MMPFHSWSVPGRNPGTSTNVTSGRPKASHVRTKRAALTDESMSSTPASALRLVADDADGVAVEPREAAHDVARPSRSWISKKSPSSTTCRMTALMS